MAIFEEICENCGREFEVLFKQNKKFCDRNCKSEFRKKRRRQELIDSGLLVPRKNTPKIVLDPTILYKNYEKMKLESRRSYVRKTFGLTLEEHDELRVSVSICCICGTDKPMGRDKKFVVDHCHTAGKIRGVICNNCNQGLGFMRHDVGVLRKAIEYLEKFSQGLG